MKAHSTAVIDPQAEIAPDAEIGPYAIIEGGARIGSGCRIGSHAHLLGRVHLDRDCHIGAGAILGADPQSVSFDPAVKSGVVLGPRNRVREYATIHRSLFEGQDTRLGSDNFLMTGAHIGHDVILGDGNIVANNCLLAGHVTVGDRNFLGGGSVYHQFIRVGSGVMVQGLAGLSQDAPPFVIVTGINRIAGINAVGLRRAKFDTPTRTAIKRAFDLVYRQNLNLTQALEQADQTQWEGPAALFLDFFREKSHRGICLQTTLRPRENP